MDDTQSTRKCPHDLHYDDYCECCDTVEKLEVATERVKNLESMISKKLELIKCGVAHNYCGNPYENPLYTEARDIL